MKSIKFLILSFLLSLHIQLYSQTNDDSTFIKEIINLELEVRDKKIKKAYPIFNVSAFSNIKTRSDTIYTEINLGKEINWETFGINSDYGFFTNDKMIDSCLYIHAPMFNMNKDKFIIKYEVRFQNLTSYFVVDYYRKKRGKWNFERSTKSISF